MKKVLLVILMFVCVIANAQTDTSISLDQLQVPSTPAFNILGVSPNDIERPKNPTDFAVALGNATSGFTAIPKDYAIELSPFWIFGKRQATFKDFRSNKPGMNILQTATLSAATTSGISQIDSSEFRKVAIALKFSIFRGELRDEFKQWNDSVSMYLHKSSEILGKIRAEYNTQRFAQSANELKSLTANLDSSKTDADKKKWSDSITFVRNSIIADIAQFEIISEKKVNDSIKIIISSLKDLASRKDFKRYGFKLDFAMGSVMDYPDSTFQTCYVSKFSSWLTLGWENPLFNFLGVGRYSENINHRYRNDSNEIVNNINIGEVDLGLRVYRDFTEKFTLSFEYIKRLSVFNRDNLDKNFISHPVNTNRYVISMNYKVGKNQNLSFVYGKDFDNSYIKKGNLIAALNLLIGFGSSRPFGNK